MMSPDKGDRSCGGLDTFNDIFHWSYRHRLCPALLIQLAHPCYVLVAIRSDPPSTNISSFPAPALASVPLPSSTSQPRCRRRCTPSTFFVFFMTLHRPPGSINIDSKWSKSWLCGCPNRMQNVGSAFKRVRNLIRFFPMCLLLLCCIFFGSVDVNKKRVVVRCVLVTGYLCKKCVVVR